MPPLHPPKLHFHKLKKRARAGATGSSGSHRPAAMAKMGLAAILYKLHDVHRPPSSPPSPSPAPSPSAHYRQLCYQPPPSAWPWPSCRHPRTSSFRARQEDAAVYRTVNTVYDTSSEHFLRRPSLDEASCFDRSFVAVEPEEWEEEKELQLGETAVVWGVQSERLFFEPAGAEFLPKQVMQCMSCIIPPDERFQEKVRGSKTEATTAMDVTTESDDEATTALASTNEAAAAAKETTVLKGGAVVVTVESEDPYGDFQASMAEMVAAHGLRDWEGLEELLAWYLKLNAKGVHGVIVGAFVDLLVSLASSPSPSLPSPSPSSLCITFEEYSSATRGGNWAVPCRHGPGLPCFGPLRAVLVRPSHPVVPCRAGPPRLRSGPSTAQSPPCRRSCRASPSPAQSNYTRQERRRQW